MDVYCYKNFYDQLTKDICIVATYAQTTEWDPCENFLFAGSKEHFFFLTCFEYGIFKLLNYTKEDLFKVWKHLTEQGWGASDEEENRKSFEEWFSENF